MDICSSPKLFAAYHVFHRLLVPRHPPCALIRLTNFLCHVASRQLVWVFIKFMFSQDLPKQFSEDHYVLWLPLGNLLGCLSLKYLRKNFLFCMRFSRYIFIWLFYQPSKTKRFFNLRSLVKPVIYNSASPLKQVNTFIPVRWVFILLRARTCLFYIKSKMLSFVIPAATCSPVPSPAKYHRPPMS